MEWSEELLLLQLNSFSMDGKIAGLELGKVKSVAKNRILPVTMIYLLPSNVSFPPSLVAQVKPGVQEMFRIVCTSGGGVAGLSKIGAETLVSFNMLFISVQTYNLSFCLNRVVNSCLEYSTKPLTISL